MSGEHDIGAGIIAAAVLLGDGKDAGKDEEKHGEDTTAGMDTGHGLSAEKDD